MTKYGNSTAWNAITLVVVALPVVLHTFVGFETAVIASLSIAIWLLMGSLEGLVKADD